MAVLKTTPQKLEANSCFHEKSLVLATHGRWLAKGPEKGSASDRPRQASLYLLIQVLPPEVKYNKEGNARQIKKMSVEPNST